MESRILNKELLKKVVTADEAAKLFKNNMVVAASGFTPAGYPKAVPLALAKRVEGGDDIGITLITGASVGEELDGVLAKAGVIKRRYPYQTESTMRNAINEGHIEYADMHLSHVAPWMKNGYFGDIDIAIIEATMIDEDGNIIPSTSVGISNTAVECAKQVIVEVNTYQPIELVGVHDIYDVERAPFTKPIPITSSTQKIGTPYIKCDPKKIVAIVVTNIPDKTRSVAPVDKDSEKMAQNLIKFLKSEVEKGRLPKNLLPLQSGVGSVANAVLSGLNDSDFENLTVYSEVLQDSVLDLLDSGKVTFASATSLTISPEKLDYFYENINRYKDRIVLRPQEISNNPEVIRRIGVIAMNTAIEVDIYGNVNSTHINGTRLMNGIGGSGDFARSGYLTIFTTVSTAKNGTVSSIVPFVTHVDHTEHDTHVIITEQGVADLRALSPIERARCIIENCVHPDYKDSLNKYLENSLKSCKHKHIPHVLSSVFEAK